MLYWRNEDDFGDHELRRGSHRIGDNAKKQGTVSAQKWKEISPLQDLLCPRVLNMYYR